MGKSRARSALTERVTDAIRTRIGAPASGTAVVAEDVRGVIGAPASGTAVVTEAIPNLPSSVAFYAGLQPLRQ